MKERKKEKDVILLILKTLDWKLQFKQLQILLAFIPCWVTKKRCYTKHIKNLQNVVCGNCTCLNKKS